MTLPTKSGSASKPTSTADRVADPGRADAHAQWIYGRARTLLLHYFEKDAPPDLIQAALADWVVVLETFTEEAIEHACQSYLQAQPRIRPTPADIAQRAKLYTDTRAPRKAPAPSVGADRGALSHDERELLEAQVLPKAREWVRGFPALAYHGAKTLAYWGEHVTLSEAKDLRRFHAVTLPKELVQEPQAYSEYLQETNPNAV
jgi:hypothetical protein